VSKRLRTMVVLGCICFVNLLVAVVLWPERTAESYTPPQPTDEVPGAQNVADWYIDCVTGSDTNNCITPGTACASLTEPFRRIGRQPIPAMTAPQVNIAANCQTAFANQGLNFNVDALGGEFPYTVGFYLVTAARIYTGADGGALGNFTLKSYTAWNGGSKQEGIAYFVATVDGGPAYDPIAMGPDAGCGLENLDSGATIYCGDKIDSGTCNIAGEYALNSFEQAEPSANNTYRLFTLVQIATNPATATVTFTGTAGPDFQNVAIGSGTHSIQAQTANTNGLASPVIEASIINGLDIAPGVLYAGAGNAYANGHLHTYGVYQTLGSELFLSSTVETRLGGYWLNFSGLNVLAAGGTIIESGCTEAGGTLENDGLMAFTQYGVPLTVCAGAQVFNTGTMWFKNSVSGSAAVQAKSGGLFTYNSGHAPGFTGTVATIPWIVGGTQYDGGTGLPQVNTTNLSGIVVNQ
jgi:hypothetical protein